MIRDSALGVAISYPQITLGSSRGNIIFDISHFGSVGVNQCPNFIFRYIMTQNMPFSKKKIWIRQSEAMRHSVAQVHSSFVSMGLHGLIPLKSQRGHLGYVPPTPTNSSLWGPQTTALAVQEQTKQDTCYDHLIALGSSEPFLSLTAACGRCG